MSSHRIFQAHHLQWTGDFSNQQCRIYPVTCYSSTNTNPSRSSVRRNFHHCDSQFELRSSGSLVSYQDGCYDKHGYHYELRRMGLETLHEILQVSGYTLVVGRETIFSMLESVTCVLWIVKECSPQVIAFDEGELVNPYLRSCSYHTCAELSGEQVEGILRGHSCFPRRNLVDWYIFLVHLCLSFSFIRDASSALPKLSHYEEENFDLALVAHPWNRCCSPPWNTPNGWICRQMQRCRAIYHSPSKLLIQFPSFLLNVFHYRTHKDGLLYVLRKLRKLRLWLQSFMGCFIWRLCKILFGATPPISVICIPLKFAALHTTVLHGTNIQLSVH